MDHNLMEVLLPLTILGTMALGIIFLTKTLTDYFLKKKIVEKGLLGPDAAEMFKTQVDNSMSSLKWGLIILFGGIGLIVIDMVNFDSKSPLPFGIFAVSLSLGFLTYFMIIKRNQNKDHA